MKAQIVIPSIVKHRLHVCLIRLVLAGLGCEGVGPAPGPGVPRVDTLAQVPAPAPQPVTGDCSVLHSDSFCY